MAYKLIDGIYLVEGALNGALLDTNTGRIYSINRAGCDVISYRIEDSPYWESLLHMGIAEECQIGTLNPLPSSTSGSLRFAWFEIISDDCNERCIQCYANSMPPSYRKAQSIPLQMAQPTVTTEPSKKLTYKDWQKVIKEVYELGCRRCQFIGGEPFLYKGENGETVLELVAYAFELGYQSVEVFTNATLITEAKAKALAQLGAKVAVSLYSDVPEIHDTITRTEGSHSLTMKALERLKKHEVPVRVEIVLMRQNQETAESSMQLRNKLGFKGKRPDPLRPKGRGDSPLLQPDFATVVKYGLMLRPHFRASKGTIARYSQGNACLNGKITISDSGEVYPCIFARNKSIGNVLDADISTVVLGTETQAVWSATKDSVLVCKDCEYRYVCFDCRPLSQGVAGAESDFFTMPYPRCTYNPYTGEWAQGLWRMVDNEPVYVRDFGPKIQEVLMKELQI